MLEADQYVCNLNLGMLNATEGFAVFANQGLLGYSLADLGDVNGDLTSDLLIGAPLTSSVHKIQSGSAYIIFGNSSGFPLNFNLSSSIDGRFVQIQGISSSDNLGISVAGAGDVNGDGLNDIMLGAPNAKFGFGPGQAYIIFGSKPFPANVNLFTLNGQNGFTVSGVNATDNLGVSVSFAGDVNLDGINDIIIGNPNNDENTGQAIMFFGSKSPFVPLVYSTLLTGFEGFYLSGTDYGDLAGFKVAGIGDFNGDKIDDFMVSATGLSSYVGGVYIVFGTASGFPKNFILSSVNGQNGFLATLASGTNTVGIDVKGIGDVNGDGLNDVIVSSLAKRAFVIFGNEQNSQILYLGNLNGQNGFTITDKSQVQVAWSVAGVGDVNGDGLADIAIGNSGFNNNAGQVVIIYGALQFPSTIAIDNIMNNTGYYISNPIIGSKTGYSVSSAGDINNDGIADIAIGAPSINTTYVVYGSKGSTNIPCTLDPSFITSSSSISATSTKTPTQTMSFNVYSSKTMSCTPSPTKYSSSNASIPSHLPPYDPSSSDDNLSPGQIAGIVVGILGGIGLIGVAYCLYNKYSYNINRLIFVQVRLTEIEFKPSYDTFQPSQPTAPLGNEYNQENDPT